MDELDRDDADDLVWEVGLAAAFQDQSADTETGPTGFPGTGASLLRLRRSPGEEPARPWAASEEIARRGGRAGRFELLGEIARGGVGVVLHAFDPELGREVAMKVLHEQHATRPEFVQRFVEEAQIGGQLQHPGILPVYEIGLDARQRPYFTMKLVAGRTLADALRERDPEGRDLHRWLAIFASVCQTVAYAHARGVVHRDLKPRNVMVGAFGEVHVMDWGLAKVLDREPLPAPRIERDVVTIRSEGSGASLAGSVLGTPAYMAPEQARGDIAAVDERSDVFALGAILLEILTGQPPYGADASLADARAADLAPARTRLAETTIDPLLRELVEGCLRERPEDRLRDAGELETILTGYRASVEERARSAEIARHRGAVQLRAERKTRRVTVALAATAIALVIVVLGFLHLRAIAREETRADVERKLQEAWHATSIDDLDAALARASEARALHGASGLDASLGREIDQTLADVAARKRDRTLRDALLRVRAHPLGDPRAFEGYEDALSEFLGEERPFDTARALARIRARESTLEGTLARSLEDWARRLVDLPSGARRAEPLLRVADGLDDDPLRTAIRAAWSAGDAEGLQTLRATVETERAFDVDGETVTLLSQALAARGEFASARTLLERAFEVEHTNDFWLNWNLAALHHLAGQPERAARHERLLPKLAPIEGWDPVTGPPERLRGPGPDGPPPRRGGEPGRRRGDWRRWVEELEGLPDGDPRRPILEDRLRKVLRDLGDRPHPERRRILEALRS